MKCMNEEVLVNEISEETGGAGWMLIVCGSICLVGLSTGSRLIYWCRCIINKK